MKRPRGVVAIAIYQALFSAVLLSTLVWQAVMHHPQDGWLYATPVLLMMFFVSLLPAVFAYGLWIMDEGARIAIAIFTVLHAISTVVYLSGAPTYWRPWTRLAIDAVIIAYLFLRSTRRAFRQQQELLLRWNP
jgi:hypothetical protein